MSFFAIAVVLILGTACAIPVGFAICRSVIKRQEIAIGLFFVVLGGGSLGKMFAQLGFDNVLCFHLTLLCALVGCIIGGLLVLPWAERRARAREAAEAEKQP